MHLMLVVVLCCAAIIFADHHGMHQDGAENNLNTDCDGPNQHQQELNMKGGRAARLIRSVFLGDTDNGQQNRPMPYRNYNGADEQYEEPPRRMDPGPAEETGSE